MELYFSRIINSVLNAPHMVFVSLAVAVAFVIGGIILYKMRGKIKGWRWPGVTCTLLGCASLATTAVQHMA